MTKQEFLENLRLALNGKVPGNVVTENLQYYEDYINTEIRKGRSEEEVLAALGDPRLIARTIVTANMKSDKPTGNEHREYSGARQPEDDRKAGMPVWVWLILGIIIVVLVFSAVFSLLSIILPVLIPILIVLFLVKLFRDWLN